ncbi:hypothetical protein CPC08DRAFT_728802 [Agrocybe pediades]|nr:hypothetical protein CPC08DRAFT_728802 [Agrocybe pediades]
MLEGIKNAFSLLWKRGDDNESQAARLIPAPYHAAAPSIPFYPGDPRFNFGPSLGQGTGPNIMGSAAMYPSSYYATPPGLVQAGPVFAFQHGSHAPPSHPGGFMYPSMSPMPHMSMPHYPVTQAIQHPLNSANPHPVSGQGPQTSAPLPSQTLSSAPVEPTDVEKGSATPIEPEDTSSIAWPQGYVLREIEEGTETRNWKQTKWQWRSIGPVKRNSRTVELRNCLGVVVCTDCERVYRPRTDAASRKRQLLQACTGKSSARSQPCGASLAHVECAAQAHHYKVERDGVIFLVWEHFGLHQHLRPPNGRLTAEEEESLDQQVSQRPSASAHEYRTGDSLTRATPLGEIAPALSNPRKARYEVEKSRTRLGLDGGRINKGLTGFLGSIMHFEERLPKPFVIDSRIHGPTYLAFQTPFMRQILEESVDSWKDSSDGPHHGLVTDGDHTYFKEGVLNVTCAFSNVLCAWVPVLYTWIYKLDISHHRPHFRHISQTIVQYTKEKKISLEPKYLLHVTDFSAAQRAAHADEYADAIISTKPDFHSLTLQSQAIERAAYLKEAESAERGCDFHFWQSAERLTSNASLIPVADVPDFNRQLRIMTSRSTSLEDFNAAVKRIKDSYKRVGSWLSWWLRPAFASMIFPAVSSMDPNLSTQVPSTANAAEHSHSLLHHASGKNHDLVQGIEMLYLHVEEMEKQHSAIKGESNIQFAGHFDPPAPRTYKPRARKEYDANDGRPPDTQNALLPEGIRDASTQNEHFLQSYVWDSPNSCFFDNGLELLFRSVACLAHDVKASLLQKLPINSYLSSLLYHYDRRLKAIYAAPDSRRVGDDNELMQLVTRNFIFDRWELYSSPTAHGCSKSWITRAILDGNTPREVKEYFGVYHLIMRACPNDHSSETYASYNPQIMNSLFSRDINMIQQRIGSDKQQSLTDYFNSLIPRIPLPRDANGGRLLHTMEEVQCSACPESAVVTSITTLWPHVLHLEYSASSALPSTQTVPLVHYPHTFSIKSSTGAIVSYELVGRVLHKRDHFTSELRISGDIYIFDDMKRDGRLRKKKNSTLLEKPNPQAVYYVYHRKSVCSKYNLTCNSTQDDAPCRGY